MPLMSSPRSSYAIEIVGTRFVYVEWGAHDLLAIDTNVSISYKSIYVCVCVCLYKKHEFSVVFGKCCGGCGRGGCALWHATQFGWSCRLLLLLLLPVSPGVVGVFLARAAI